MHSQGEIAEDSQEKLKAIVQEICQLDNLSELREKIKQLPDEDAKILELFYFEKLSCAEISIRLESKGYPRYTEVTIRQKKCRAIKKLRQSDLL